MADEVDSLILEASVLDDFSENLDDLEEQLLKIQGQHEQMNPLDVDAAVAEAIGDLQALKAVQSSIDENMTVDVDTEWEQKQIFGNLETDKETMWQLFGIQTGEGLWQDNPFEGPEWEAGTRDRHGNFNAAPGLWAEGAGGDVAKDLVQAQRDAWDMDGPGDSRFKPLTDAIEQFKDLRLSMGLFMNILASLIPLVGVFVGALPAAIGGIAALGAAALAAAAGLYGLVGLGLLGMATTGGEFNFAKLQARIQEVLDSFLSAFAPIGDSLEPLMEDIFTNLEMLFFDVAMRMRQLMSLTDEARRGMNMLMGAIGPTLEQTVMLAEAALPLLLTVAQKLGEIDIFNIIADLIAETAPLIFYMASAIGRSLPAIYNLSRGFLTVSAALVGVFSGMVQLLNVVPFLAEGFGILIGLTLTAITASALYSLAMSSVATRVLAVAAGLFQSLIPGLYSTIAAEYGATVATLSLASAAALLLGILTFGLAPMLAGISSHFSILGDDISTATDELRSFSRMSRRTSMSGLGGSVDGMGGGPSYSKPTSAYTQGSSGTNVQNTVVAPDKETGNAVANTLGFMQRSSSKTDGDQVSDRQHGI